jgi:hypothetical protein
VGDLRHFAVVVGRKRQRDVVNNTALHYFRSADMPSGLSSDWTTARVSSFAALDFVANDCVHAVAPARVTDPVVLASMNKATQYAQTLQLKPGMPLLLVRNFALDRDLANGSKLFFIEEVRQDEDMYIKCSVASTNEIVLLKRERDESDSLKIVRYQFPVIGAIAVTVHKMQGMSTDHIFTSLGVPGLPDSLETDAQYAADMFANAQGYVGLSRARTLQGIHLASFDRRSIVANPKVVEFTRATTLQDCCHVTSVKSSLPTTASGLSTDGNTAMLLLMTMMSTGPRQSPLLRLNPMMMIMMIMVFLCNSTLMLLLLPPSLRVDANACTKWLINCRSESFVQNLLRRRLCRLLRLSHLILYQPKSRRRIAWRVLLHVKLLQIRRVCLPLSKTCSLYHART